MQREAETSGEKRGKVKSNALLASLALGDERKSRDSPPPLETPSSSPSSLSLFFSFALPFLLLRSLHLSLNLALPPLPLLLLSLPTTTTGLARRPPRRRRHQVQPAPPPGRRRPLGHEGRPPPGARAAAAARRDGQPRPRRLQRLGAEGVGHAHDGGEPRREAAGVRGVRRDRRADLPHREGVSWGRFFYFEIFF